MLPNFSGKKEISSGKRRRWWEAKLAADFFSKMLAIVSRLSVRNRLAGLVRIFKMRYLRKDISFVNSLLANLITRRSVAWRHLKRLCSRLNKSMMPSGKLYSRQPKNSKTAHYESRVQSNSRADFKLTYRENYGKLWKTFFWGGGGG